jgi:hypothetical protein
MSLRGSQFVGNSGEICRVRGQNGIIRNIGICNSDSMGILRILIQSRASIF